MLRSFKWPPTVGTVLSLPQMQSRAQESHFGNDGPCDAVTWLERQETCWASFRTLYKVFFINVKWPLAFCPIFLPFWPPFIPVLSILLHVCSLHLPFPLGPPGPCREGWFSLRLCFSSAHCTQRHFYFQGWRQCWRLRADLGLEWNSRGEVLWCVGWGGVGCSFPPLSVPSEEQLNLLYLLPSRFLGLYFPRTWHSFMRSSSPSIDPYLSFFYSVPSLMLLIRYTKLRVSSLKHMG